MDGREAIVLAAGVGSRMGESTTSKCLLDIIDGNPSLLYSLSMLYENGYKNVSIVIGYQGEMISSYLNEADIPSDMSIRLFYNSNYRDYGSNYSLATPAFFLSELYMKSPFKLIVVEADSIYDSINFPDINSNWFLSRDSSYIDTRRSVVGMSIKGNGCVDKFVYDQEHRDVSELYLGDSELYESMQIFSFDTKSTKLLLDSLTGFIDKVDKGDELLARESDLYSINEVARIHSLIPIEPPDCDGWINLNSKEDLEKARNSDWVRSINLF